MSDHRIKNKLLLSTALAVVACSPVERLAAFKRERGWRFLPLYSSASQQLQRQLSGRIA